MRAELRFLFSLLTPPPTTEYRELKPARIQTTLQRLHQRIGERFPESGLRKVAAELMQLGEEVAEQTGFFRQAILPIRLFVVFSVLILVTLSIAGVVYSANMVSDEGANFAEFLQALEAGTNELIFLAIALFFLVTLEGRVKRVAALRMLHRLRSIAHVIDMHQLTKDPVYLIMPDGNTESSPDRPMTLFQLTRYLDYCAELLALVSKLAALHAQHLDDPVVLEAVNEVETLAQGLSNKIWQKIMIMEGGVNLPKETV